MTARPRIRSHPLFVSLGGTWSLGHAQLQGMLGNVVSLAAMCLAQLISFITLKQKGYWGKGSSLLQCLITVC